MIKIIVLIKDISLNPKGTCDIDVKIIVNDGVTQLEETLENIDFISNQEELENVVSNQCQIKLEEDLGFSLKQEDIFVLY